jgi:hypothetical protein
MASHNDHDFGGPRDQCPYCRADLEAETARLQTALEGAEKERDRALGELTASISEGHKWDEMYDKAIGERDAYKARDKLRREEILKSGEDCRYCGRWHHFTCCHITWISTREQCPGHPCSKRCKEARAAIDITSKEARKKEG